MNSFESSHTGLQSRHLTSGIWRKIIMVKQDFISMLEMDDIMAQLFVRSTRSFQSSQFFES